MWFIYGNLRWTRTDEATRRGDHRARNILDKCLRVALVHWKISRIILLTTITQSACWASAGYATAGCAAVEQALRDCMDGPKAPPKKKNNINFHLSRFQKYIEGNTKK